MTITKQQILERAKMFKKFPKTNGIYFLINNDEIIYIGSSTDCHKRIKMHKKNKKMKFNGFHIVKRKDKQQRLKLETEYIKLYKPLLNLACIVEFFCSLF